MKKVHEGEFLALYNKRTRKQMAKHFGVSERYISQFARELGLEQKQGLTAKHYPYFGEPKTKKEIAFFEDKSVYTVRNNLAKNFCFYTKIKMLCKLILDNSTIIEICPNLIYGEYKNEPFEIWPIEERVFIKNDKEIFNIKELI